MGTESRDGRSARSDIVSIALAITCLALLLPTGAKAQEACPADQTPICQSTTVCLGLNTGFFGYSSLDKMFIDQMRGAGVSVAGYDPDSIAKNPAIDLDENQYPTELGRTVSVVFYSNVAGTFTTKMLPAGRYVILWDGAAASAAINGPGASNAALTTNRLAFDLNTSVVGNTFFTYTNTANHVRNIRIVPAAYEADYQNWSWSDYKIGSPRNPPIFFPAWLQKMSTACTIRYMNSRGINDADAVRFNRDSTETMVNPASSTWYNGFGLGADAFSAHVLPWELIVEITRQTNTRPWLNFGVMAYESHLAGDPIIRRVSRMFAQHYGGTVYTEYGNEIWNFAYPFNVASNHVRLNGPGTRDNLPENYAKRSNLVHRVFQEAYGDNKCLALGVLASQGRNPFLGQQVIAFADTQYIDVFSPTTYVGDNLVPGNAPWNFVEGLYSSVENGALTEDQAFSRIRNELLTGNEGIVVRNWRNDVGPFTQAYIDMADSRGICSAFYEAGLHMRVDDVDVSNPLQVGVRDFVRRYQRSTQQATVEREVTNYLRTRSTGPNILFSSFDNAGGGTFSYWDSVFEPMSRQSPRAGQIPDFGDGGGTGVPNKAAVAAIVRILRVLDNRLAAVPDRAYTSAAAKRRLLGFARTLRSAAVNGRQVPAEKARRQMLGRVNGCGTRPDGNDAIRNCTIQQRLKVSLDDLRLPIRNL